MMRRMTKSRLLFHLEMLRKLEEEGTIQPVYKDAIIDVLLDYIGDKDIREKVEGIAL